MIHEGQITDAIRFLETARRFNPRLSPDWSNMLGVAYFLEQRYDEAIGLLEGLRVQFPEFAYVHVALAAIYAELDDAPAAGSAVTNVRRLAPFFDANGFSQQYLSKETPTPLPCRAQESGTGIAQRDWVAPSKVNVCVWKRRIPEVWRECKWVPLSGTRLTF